MERGLKPVSCVLVMQAGTLGRPACARRCPAVRPQSRKIVFGQMIQDPLDDRRVFDARDDLDRSSALRAGLDIDPKHTLEALRPAHCRSLLGRCAVFQRLRPPRLAASPSAGRCDPRPVGTVRRKHPVEAGQIQTRRRHERRQPSVPLGRLRPCHCQRARRRLHQAAVRRQPRSRIRRRPCWPRQARWPFRPASPCARWR